MIGAQLVYSSISTCEAWRLSEACWLWCHYSNSLDDESCEPNKNNPVQRENYQLGPKTWSQKKHGGVGNAAAKDCCSRKSVEGCNEKPLHHSTIIIQVPLKIYVKYGTLLDTEANWRKYLYTFLIIMDKYECLLSLKPK